VLLFVHFSDLDDLAHDFRLEAAAFGFGVDFLDIFAERALLIFEPLNAPLSDVAAAPPRRQQDDNRASIA